jgi:hypothetical protein
LLDGQAIERDCNSLFLSFNAATEASYFFCAVSAAAMSSAFFFDSASRAVLLAFALRVLSFQRGNLRR